MATATARASPSRVPETPREIKQRLAADRLEARLYKANLATYAATVNRHAQALGQGRTIRPRDITHPEVLDGLKARARISATSIVATAQSRREALIEQAGSKSAAKAAFSQWSDAQGAKIAAFESGQAAQQAAEDFAARNALVGSEHLEPADAAAPDECQDAIDAGEVAIGTLGSFPAHLNCPHYVVRAYDPVDDPAALWVGGDAEENA